jgi:hypothetical protein
MAAVSLPARIDNLCTFWKVAGARWIGIRADINTPRVTVE